MKDKLSAEVEEELSVGEEETNEMIDTEAQQVEDIIPLIPQEDDDQSKSKLRLPHKSYLGRRRVVFTGVSIVVALVLIGKR
jgi:hypothetical protein